MARTTIQVRIAVPSATVFCLSLTRASSLSIALTKNSANRYQKPNQMGRTGPFYPTVPTNCCTDGICRLVGLPAGNSPE